MKLTVVCLAFIVGVVHSSNAITWGTLTALKTFLSTESCKDKFIIDQPYGGTDGIGYQNKITLTSDKTILTFGKASATTKTVGTEVNIAYEMPQANAGDSGPTQFAAANGAWNAQDGTAVSTTLAGGVITLSEDGSKLVLDGSSTAFSAGLGGSAGSNGVANTGHFAIWIDNACLFNGKVNIPTGAAIKLAVEATGNTYSVANWLAGTFTTVGMDDTTQLAVTFDPAAFLGNTTTIKYTWTNTQAHTAGDFLGVSFPGFKPTSDSKCTTSGAAAAASTDYTTGTTADFKEFTLAGANQLTVSATAAVLTCTNMVATTRTADGAFILRYGTATGVATKTCKGTVSTTATITTAAPTAAPTTSPVVTFGGALSTASCSFIAVFLCWFGLLL